MTKPAAPPATSPEDDQDTRGIRRLCHFGPLFGAVWLGALAIVIDYYVPPPDVMQGGLDAAGSAEVSIIVSFWVGAIAGWAYGDSVLHEIAGRFEQAIDSSVRWGLAGLVLFLLAPLADFDFARHHLALQYLLMFRAYLPCIVASLLLLARGYVLSRNNFKPKS